MPLTPNFVTRTIYPSVLSPLKPTLLYWSWQVHFLLAPTIYMGLKWRRIIRHCCFSCTLWPACQPLRATRGPLQICFHNFFNNGLTFLDWTGADLLSFSLRSSLMHLVQQYLADSKWCDAEILLKLGTTFWKDLLVMGVDRYTVPCMMLGDPDEMLIMEL